MHERYDEFDLEALIHQAMNQGSRMDEDLALFMARQVDYLKTKAYEVEYGANSALTIFPQTSELPSETRVFLYGVYSDVGMAKIIADYSDDLPLVDEHYREESGRVYRIGNGFQMSIDEVKIAQRAGVDMSGRKARSARKFIDNKIDDLVWKGDASHQILSVFQHPNLPKLVSAGWTNGDIALAELETAITNIKVGTRNNHRANRVVIPPSTNKMFTKRADGTMISIRDYFVTQYPGLEWHEAYALEDIDGAGTKAALVFEYDPDNLSVEIPEPFNQLAPQAQDLHWKVPCTAKATGLTIYRPLTMELITGI